MKDDDDDRPVPDAIASAVQAECDALYPKTQAEFEAIAKRNWEAAKEKHPALLRNWGAKQQMAARVIADRATGRLHEGDWRPAEPEEREARATPRILTRVSSAGRHERSEEFEETVEEHVEPKRASARQR